MTVYITHYFNIRMSDFLNDISLKLLLYYCPFKVHLCEKTQEKLHVKQFLDIITERKKI